MALPWQWHGNAMALPWQCHGNAMASPKHCHGHTMSLPWQCHGTVMAWPWHGNATGGVKALKIWSAIGIVLSARPSRLSATPSPHPTPVGKYFGASGGPPRGGPISPETSGPPGDPLELSKTPFGDSCGTPAFFDLSDNRVQKPETADALTSA